jgi:hypothetical protein
VCPLVKTLGVLNMSLEIEVLRQILDDNFPLEDVIGFIELKDGDGWTIIQNHYNERNVQIFDENKDPLKDFVIKDLFRNKATFMPIFIRCSDKGRELAS